MVLRKFDKQIAIVFLGLTILFILALGINEDFFNWAYTRHQNKLSWYIRPLFLIPFCYFAYKHSRAGISLTIYCLFTSMCWFSVPVQVSASTKAFLQYEMDWLTNNWTLLKFFLTLSVPVSFIALGYAFWNKNLWIGLFVVALMATGKIIWSIQNAGQSGYSILLPAIMGLITCSIFIYFGFRNLEKRK